MRFKLPNNQEYDDLVEEAEFETLPYHTSYKIRIEVDITDKQKEVNLGAF